MTTNRYRITFKSGPTSGVVFIEAANVADAVAAVALTHDPFELLDVRRSPSIDSPPLEQQRDALVKSLRALHTVLRAMLDNPTTTVLFVGERRTQLERMLADAQEAMLDAGVTK